MRSSSLPLPPLISHIEHHFLFRSDLPCSLTGCLRFHRWIGCLQGFSCNIYKCCLHHSPTTKHGNGVAVALLRLCVQYVWNKKGKLFSQAVLCFIIGSVRGCPHCTELASGDCQGRPRSDPRGWWLLQKTELLEYLTIT